MARPLLLSMLLQLALTACGGDDHQSAEASNENADAWCCDGSWEECRPQTQRGEGVCFGIVRCGPGQTGTVCAKAGATSFCVWTGEELTLEDGTRCRLASGWTYHAEHDGWANDAPRCEPLTAPLSTCLE